MDEKTGKDQELCLWGWRCFECFKTIFNEDKMIKIQHGGLMLKYHQECYDKLPIKMRNKMRIN